jgi:hypothetical protein
MTDQNDAMEPEQKQDQPQWHAPQLHCYDASEAGPVVKKELGSDGGSLSVES